MAHYVPLIESSVLATVKEELERKERQQKLHYYLLEQLQSYSADVPAQYQLRLSYDLLSGLASALLDGTVFDIVKSLKEMQEMEEKSLHQQRIELQKHHSVERKELMARQRDELRECEARPEMLPSLLPRHQEQMALLERRHGEQLRSMDVTIIQILDQKVMNQQDILTKAGLPGFSMTNNATDLQLQMYLLSFILRLNDCLAASSGMLS